MYALVFSSYKYISSYLSVINFNPSALLISTIDKCLTHLHIFCGNDKNTAGPHFPFSWRASIFVNFASIWCRILHLVKLRAVSWMKPFFFQMCFNVSWTMIITIAWKEIDFWYRCFLYNFIAAHATPSLPLLQIHLLLWDKKHNYLFHQAD